MRHQAFNIAKNPKYDVYQHRFASIAYKFCDNRASGDAVKSDMQNQQLSKELSKTNV